VAESPAAIDCRLLIDPPASGAWNMAVDEMLLERSAAGEGCCWRFYRWEEPTLSLGYFQSAEDRQRHPASHDCPWVRRASGGGAILHDCELTYSLVVEDAYPSILRRPLLYETVHSALRDALSVLGIRASLATERGGETERVPVLCFRRRVPGDVLVGPTKIAGSAQRRVRGAVLQHGSVLLGRSSAAPELAGIAELGPPLAWEPLMTEWLGTLTDRFGFVWHEEPLSEWEQQRAAELARTKYGCDGWTIFRGRRPK